MNQRLCLFAVALLLAAPTSALARATGTARGKGGRTVQVQEGPVRLVITLDRRSAKVAEPILLKLAAAAPRGVTIRFPQHAGRLGAWHVRSIHDSLDIPADDGRHWTRIYQLDSLAAGAHAIPSIVLTFTDRRGGSVSHGTIQSPAMPIRIASLLEDRANPLKFRDIKDVVELPAEPSASSSRLVWTAGGVVLIALAGVALAVWTKRRRREPPPDRWALDALRQLEDSEFCCRENVHAVYFRLTDVVRGYVERRFGISAPRWTTAEFMDRARDDPRLDGTQRAALGEFLTAADLVKYACLEPTDRQIADTFVKARKFILATAPQRSKQASNPAKEVARCS